MDLSISSISGNPNFNTWGSILVRSGIYYGSSGKSLINDHGSIPPSDQITKQYNGLFVIDSDSNRRLDMSVGLYQLGAISIKLNIIISIYKIG